MKTEEYKYEWGTPEATREMKKMTPGESVRQDPDISKRKGTQPAKYYAGLSKSTKEKRDAQFKRQTKMSSRDPAAYKPAPGDKTAVTKPSIHTIAYKKKFGESKVPMLFRSKQSILEETGQVEFDTIVTKNFDICPGAVKMFNDHINKQNKHEIFMDSEYGIDNLEVDPIIKQRELLKSALEATDGYLGVEKKAMEAKRATPTDLVDFNYFLRRASSALQLLGVKETHEYMTKHTDAITKLSDYSADDYYDQAAEPLDVDYNQKSVEMYESKGLAAKAKDSGISLSTLKKVYNRGMAAWRTGHRPGTTPQQWAMARVNSYINKGKGTYHGADKDLRESKKITEQDLDIIVDNLKWEDIQPFYTKDELVEEDIEITEALSMAQRIKRRQTFARFKGRRNVAKGLKLRRTSDPSTLKRRARLAARRQLYKRFLQGRNKASLSAAEKSRIEQQVGQLKVLQNTLAAKMLPKIRGIEQKRLAAYRTAKKR